MKKATLVLKHKDIWNLESFSNIPMWLAGVHCQMLGRCHHPFGRYPWISQFFYQATEKYTMADRSRSRSPDRGAPPAEQEQYPAADNNPPQNGGDDQGQQPANGGGSGDANEASADGGGAGGEEVKLYVGNLDYGKQLS